MFRICEWTGKFDNEGLRKEIGDGRHRARQCWCDRGRANGSGSAAAGPGGSARGGDFSDRGATAGTAIQRPRGVVQLGPGQVHHPAERGSAAPHAATDSGPSPAPTDFEFEDAIINTYHAIEPWVRYGVRSGHLCGRLDSVGGLALASDHDLLQLRGTHRRKPRGQFRQLALGPAALPRGLGKRRRG